MYLLLNMFHFSHAHFTNCHSIQKEIWNFMTGFVIHGSGVALDVIIVNLLDVYQVIQLTDATASVATVYEESIRHLCKYILIHVTAFTGPMTLELINKFHYCVQNTLFYNNAC